MVVAFGNVFNNLKLVRYTQDGLTEIERINVPISYANKEKFYRRITEDPNLANQTLTVLPRMAFEMTGLTYDAQRKLSSHIDLYENAGNDTANRVKWVPYNFDFNLSIFVRNTEDGTQIVEQILPYFAPDYTVTLDFVGMDNVKLDVPIVFNTINYEPDFEGLPEPTRTLIWNLNFTMKGYLFGPINSVKIIRKVTANTFGNIPGDGTQTLKLSSGSGKFSTGELVYQGPTLESSFARAYVSGWANTSNTLIVYDTFGTFASNNRIRGIISNSDWNLNSFEYGSNQLVNLTVQPDPLSANATSAYGFDETVEEAPNIT
jgi:hypothetical protein